MKHLLILTVGICLLISIPAMADQAADEAAIRKMQQQTNGRPCQARRQGNRGSHGRGFSKLGWHGKRSGSRRKTAYGEFRTAEGSGKILDEIGIVFVTPDVAIYKFSVEITGSLDAEGKPLPPLKMLYASVCVKKNDKWLRAAVFNRPIEE